MPRSLEARTLYPLLPLMTCGPCPTGIAFFVLFWLVELIEVAASTGRQNQSARISAVEISQVRPKPVRVGRLIIMPSSRKSGTSFIGIMGAKQVKGYMMTAHKR
jgi:hypothetical protein